MISVFNKFTSGKPECRVSPIRNSNLDNAGPSSSREPAPEVRSNKNKTEEEMIRKLKSIYINRISAKVASRRWRNPILQERGDVNNILGTEFWNRQRQSFIPSLWRPLETPIFQLPERVKKMLENRQHFKAGSKMIRTSPENELGLGNEKNHSSRIKAFSLTEGLTYSYLKDTRFVLLLCLLIHRVYCLVGLYPD